MPRRPFPSRALRTRLSSAAVTLSATLTSGVSHADEPAAVVTVRADRPAADGQVLTRVDLAPRRAETLHLGNLLASVPGALALDFGGVLATSTVSLRGGTGDQAAITLDGIPLGSPAGGGLDLSLVPAALVDEARVFRGGDARRGAGAMGGAVDLVPAEGDRAVLTAGSLGTLGASASVSRELAAGDAVWKLSAAGDLRRSEGSFAYHRDPTPEVRGNDAPSRLERANNDATIASLLLRAERRSVAGTLRFTSFASASSRGLPGPVYSPTPASRQAEKSVSTQLAWLGERVDLPVSVRLGTLSTASADAWTASGEQAFLDAGARPAVRVPVGDEARLVLSGLGGIERFRGTSHGEHGRARAGLGAGLVKDKGAWTGDVAVRAEWWGGALGLLPRAGGSVRLGRGVTLLGNAGGGFRPPSFGELYYAAGPVLPNPDLRPERSWSGDVGVRLDRPADVVTLTAAATLYAGLYDDVIVYELFSGSRAKPFNLGRARTSGVELEASARLGAGLFEGLGVTLSATFLRATNLVDGPNTLGNDLPYRPRTRASAHLAYGQGRVRARAGVDWTGGAFANRANTRSIDAFADVNGSVSVRAWGGLRVGAELRNALDVTDRACIEGYPLPGRVALAHLSWEPEPARP